MAHTQIVRERGREGESVSWRERKTDSVGERECVCVCVKERERERVSEPAQSRQLPNSGLFTASDTTSALLSPAIELLIFWCMLLNQCPPLSDTQLPSKNSLGLKIGDFKQLLEFLNQRG